MNSKLYSKEGWLNSAYVESIDVPFVFVFGGRGIGKTYGMQERIDHAHRGSTFIMRRTRTEWDIITDPRMNMFSSYNSDHGTDFHFVVKKGFAEIHDGDDYIGMSAPLSTFSNLRGFDNYDHIDIMYYDEFIPERHKAKIRNEHEVFLNVYESVNRNRELKGRKPVKCVCFANSNDIKNPLFMGLNLVTMAEKMKRKQKEILIDTGRGIALVDCCYSPISQKKAQTALYRMAGEGDFYSMAIQNNFTNALYPSVSRPLIEYRAICNVGEICVYKHKSSGMIYISSKKANCSYNYSTSDANLLMFRQRYSYLQDAFFAGRVEYESNIAQLLFLAYMKII